MKAAALFLCVFGAIAFSLSALCEDKPSTVYLDSTYEPSIEESQKVVIIDYPPQQIDLDNLKQLKARVDKATGDSKKILPVKKEVCDTIECLAPKELTKKEFFQLRELVNNTDDYQRVVSLRGIIYPEKKSAEFIADKDKYYGPPLDTHNLRHGVCDEWATYFASFFVGKKGFKVFFVSYDFAQTEESYHVTVLFEDSEGWGFVNADHLSSNRYQSIREALLQAVSDMDYPRSSVDSVKIRKVEWKKGRWLADAKQSAKLRLHK